MKKILVITPLLLAISISTGMLLATKNEKEVKASGSPTAGSTLVTNINLNDNTEAEIRNYYSSLASKASSERTGNNILKNLRPILQNFTYYSYDKVWEIYEITDRDWTLSPAEGTTYGTYNNQTNRITNYVYGSNNDTKNNPYLHDLYKNKDGAGVTIEAGRIKAWDSHGKLAGGTDREHVWCQSRGFKASSGAKGPAGTDVHHLIAGDSRVNQTLHSNNPYGNVDTSKSYEKGTDYLPYLAGNLKGSPKKTSSQDQSSVVFEPQDSDKGDIARACFYMVACYNNISGNETITQYNPNLTLADYATDSGASESSSSSHAVAMGILSDLLEWNKLDPVDEYEIHRNNLIYNNYQHNRNPFIDFPQWADYIWGDKAGTAVNPATDAINDGAEEPVTTVSVTGVSVSPTSTSITVNEIKQLSATVLPSDATNKNVTWSTSNNTVAAVSDLGVVTGKKAGSAVITATTSDGGFTATCNITVTESSGSGSTQATLYSGSLTEGDYVIYYNGKAMKNTIESKRLSYSEITPSNNVIDNLDSSIIWHIAPSGDYWIIYNSAVAKYAASNGSKNEASLIQNITDNSLWSVSGESTYEFVNKANSAANVNSYLRNNNTYGFACYSTSTGGALSLYKVSNSSSATLSSVSTSGQTTEFDYNDTFVYDGTLTATYSNGSTKTVVPTTISSPNMSSAGNQTVTISYTENGVKKSCSYTITINPEVVPITGITLNKDSITMDEGENATLVATITPNNATETNIYWSSSDETIATVNDNGVVTGVAAGETTITASTEDGDIFDTCLITVIENDGIISIKKLVQDICSELSDKEVTAEEYTIKGTVTGVYSYSYFIQQGSYAMYIYSSESQPISPSVGDVVKVTSKFMNRYGQYETSGTYTAEILDEEPEQINPIVVNSASELNPEYQNSVVTFKGLTYASGTYSTSSDVSITFTTSSSESVIYRTNRFLSNATKNALNTKMQSVVNQKDTSTVNLVGVHYVIYYSNAQFNIYDASQIVIVPNSATNKDIVQSFVDNYMHMTDYDSGLTGEGTNACLGADGYYMRAKKQLTILSEEQIALFQSDDDFNNAQARYEAWAAAYGDLTPYAKTVSFSSASFRVAVDNNKTFAIIVALSMIATTGTCLFIKYKKKEQ